MAITWKHRGETFTFATPEEMMKTRALIKKEEEEAERKRAKLRFFAKVGTFNEKLDYLIAEEQRSIEAEDAVAWTPERFISFIERLGPTQQAALGVIVSRRNISDEDLRRVLKVSGNQALAGILSGISKQAAALGIPARAIFSFENLRSGGKRRSTYSVAGEFYQIAIDMNWPGPSQG